jgi:hypothetical protein
MKDIHKKLVPLHEMCGASNGPKYFLQNRFSKALNPTPSHLRSSSLLISFGIFLQGVG